MMDIVLFKMQISKLVKIVSAVMALIAIAIAMIVMIDKLDFVARWLLHIEPYKNNIERIIYAGIFVFLILWYVNRIIVAHYGKGVKALKVRVPGFGFEIEFNDDKNVGIYDGDVLAHKIDGGNSNPSSGSMQYSSIAERKIFSILKREMHLEFSPNATLIRGGCRYVPDGFAIKNGRAYIVEVKTMYRPGVIDGTIAELKTFANMVQETKISRVTVILCVVTDHPTAYLAEKIKGVNLGDETEFILRVFSPGQLERIKDVVS